MHSRIFNYYKKLEFFFEIQFGFCQKFATNDALADFKKTRLGVDNKRCFFIGAEKSISYHWTFYLPQKNKKTWN